MVRSCAYVLKRKSKGECNLHSLLCKLLHAHKPPLPTASRHRRGDHVASEDGALGHILVDGVRDDPGGHWELNRAGVHDADHVACTGRLQDAEEWPVATVLRVKFDDLLVVVGALEELDPRIEPH